MQSILNQIDQFYALNQYEEAYQYMLIQLEEAMIHKQDNIILGLLSELMGYYRVRAEFVLGNQMAIQAIKIIENLGLDKTIPSATTYLNIATLYRVQGLYKESSMYYQKAFNIYQQLLDESDERYISLYNNMSLLYQEINQLEQAIEYELKALSLIKDKENCEVETAITYTNLSQMYLTKNNYNEGMKFLNQAIDLFLQYAPQDPHYFATLASMAQAHYLKKEYTEALHIYEDVLEKIESTYGQNKDYQTVYDNYLLVQQKLNNQSFGLKLSRDYYYEIGKPMLEAKFSKYLPYMAIGLVGMGSECLGYDDKLSQDHDFGPGFCIWLPKEVYETIGQSLQVAYNQLPQEFQGYQRQISSRGQNR
ncbi:MAG: tetratricopeptide repeat protein, partial [Coprobacillus sp.]